MIDENWRLVLGFPIILNFISVCLIYSYYNILSSNANPTNNQESKTNIIVEHHEEQDNYVNSSSVNTNRSTSNAVIMQFFQQYSGISFINIFSAMMLNNMRKKGQFSLRVEYATLILLLINSLASFGSSYTSKAYGQKRTLFTGQCMMFACLLSCVAFIQLNMSIMVILTLIMFLISFQSSSGPITTLHIQETCNANVIGMVFFSNFVFNISTGFLGVYLM